jgi:hypothetical protein
LAAFNKFDIFVQDLALKKHNLNADTLKVMLSLVAPTATNAVKGDITEIAAGNGYTAGGNVATFTSGAQTSGVYKLVLQPVVFTASGGSFAAFQYATIYNATAAGLNLIGWYNYGAVVNLTNGNSFTVQLDTTNGVFTLQ